MITVQDLYQELEKSGNAPTPQERELIESAYNLAQKQHDGQERSNGEPYFNHVCAAALNCAKFGMDSQLVIAGLLHDTLEDTGLDPAVIESLFGSEVLFIVEGVTKLGKLKYRGNERHVESLRKFFVSVASDARVVIVKCADRLHNLETLEFVRSDKQRRIALESIEIYAQLASRLGMGKIAGHIADTAFPYAYPTEYKRTKEILDTLQSNNEEILAEVHREIQSHLEVFSIPFTEIDYRVKGIYSLYKKLVRKNWIIDDIHDIVALRVIVNSIDDCYRVLGIIHSLYRPVPGRIKDYIALPKPNGYQSLHTSVFAGQGNIAEIQIRTKDMHDFAEYGIASHHIYKKQQSHKFTKDSFNWLNELAELDTEKTKPSDFLKTLRTDFFSDRIFVFTPKGDVIDLPIGSTVIDFAFAVHSDIGLHATGAKINGKYSALKTVLADQMIIEIITDKKSKPSSKWLSECITTHAQKNIRNYIQKHGRLWDKLWS
jgi:RelA/SpoT family (p)ppGpp synthetase